MTPLYLPISVHHRLNAGTLVQEGTDWVVHPPSPPMYDQLLTWLEQLPRPTTGLHHWALGIGATALCLRWGSWLGTLMDETKPIDPHVGEKHWSLLSDSEMCRINIEASSNLERLLHLLHQDEFAAYDLMLRPYEHLPMPQRRVRRDLEVPRLVVSTLMAAHQAKVEARPEASALAIRHPHRALVNTVINLAYRNGPIEDLHAGREFPIDLNLRRIAPEQVRTVLRHVAERLSGFLSGVPLWHEGLGGLPPWPQRLAGLPYVWSYPMDWTMTGVSPPIDLGAQIARPGGELD